jgi:hypothetical protein
MLLEEHVFDFLEKEPPEVRDILRKIGSRLFRSSARDEDTALEGDVITEVESATRATLRGRGKPDVD